MRSPEGYSTSRGFLAFEALLAVTLGALMMSGVVSLLYFTRDAPAFVAENLESIEVVDDTMRSGVVFATSTFMSLSRAGPDTDILEVSHGRVGAVLSRSVFSDAVGRGTCDSPEYQLSYPTRSANDWSIVRDVYLGEDADNRGTGIEVRNGIAYISLDSPVSADADLVIADVSGVSSIILPRIPPRILSSLSTGPGASAVSVAGPYVYLGNTGSGAQLQVINIHDRTDPVIVAQLKLPLPWATSSPPHTRSLSYHRGKVYLGMEKWDGPEFAVIDVGDPKSPYVLGTIETGTVVTDILVYKDIAYVSAADRGQLKIVDVSDAQNPVVLKEIGPVGWQTQEGRVTERATSTVYFGRTVGGFNNTSNHEIFTLGTSTTEHQYDTVERSRDLPGGVYGIVPLYGYVYLVTGGSGGSIEVWNPTDLTKIDEFGLGFRPADISCDHGKLYVTH